MSARKLRPAVARIWEGRTRASMAKEYAAYLHEQGVKRLRGTKGNLGVEVFCRKRGGVAEFMTISYWTSRGNPRLRRKRHRKDAPPAQGPRLPARAAALRQAL